MDRKIEKKKIPAPKVLLYPVLIVVVLFLFYRAFFSDTSSSMTVDLSRITVSEVVYGPFQEFIPVNGTVIPIRTVYLDAVEGGRIDRIFYEGGNLVKEGETILVMVNNNLQLDVLNREAQILEQINNLQNTRLALQKQRIDLRSQLLTQETELEQRKREYDLETELYNRNLTSEYSYLDAQQRYNQVLRRRDLFAEQIVLDSIATENQLRHIDASLDRMMVNLDMVTSSMDNLTLKAPISGQLTSLDAEIGESKSRGQRLGQIDVIDGYKVRVAIDEFYITRINLGQTGDFDLSGDSYRLEITKIYPEVVDGRFQVDMEFTDEVSGGLRRGQTVRIRLELGERSDALLLPRGAFFQQTGGNWIFVLNETGTEATRKSLSLGRQNPQFFEVTDGLVAGERVITSSYENFGNNDRLILR